MAGIEERIEVTGAEESTQRLNQVAAAQQRVGETADEAGTRGQQAGGKFDALGAIWGRAAGMLTGLVGGLVGASGLNAALQVNREEIEASQKALKEWVDALAATVALTQDPGFLRVATNAAIEGGRPIMEIGESLFAIASGTAGSTRDEQEALLREVLELGKAEPLTPLGKITDLVVRLRNVSAGTLDAQQIQNLIAQVEGLGQVDIGDLGRFLPRTIKPGEVAGLSLPETAGIFALLSQVFRPEQAATATENILTRLAAPGEGAEAIFGALGLGADSTARERLRALVARQATQPLSAREIRDLVGEGPGAAALPTLLGQFDRLDDFQQQIAEAIAPGAPDLGALRVQTLRQHLPGFAAVELTRQAEQRLAAARRADPEVERRQALRAGLEEELIAQDRSGFMRWLSLHSFDWLSGLGFNPDTALQGALPGPWHGTGRVAERIVERVTVNIGTQYVDRDPMIDPPPAVDRGN